MSSSRPPPSPPVSQDEARFQPPFPPSGAAAQSTQDSLRDRKLHTGAEDLLNAAAVHVFPEHPVPTTEEGGSSKDKSDTEPKRPGRAEQKEPEQEPIAKGTPLDELLTPGLGALSHTLSSAGTNLPTLREQASPVPTPATTNNETASTQPLGAAVGANAESPVPSPQPTQDDPIVTSGAPSVAASKRPGFGPGREIGSVRMGASALFSALNALPWEEDDDEATGSEEEEKRHRRMFGRKEKQKPQRPKATRMHSSLHTIRPMATPTAEEPVDLGGQGYFPPPSVHHSLHFPFRQNTIARRAQRPSEQELSYQFAGRPPQGARIPSETPAVVEDVEIADERRRSEDTDGGLPINSEARAILERQVTEEAKIAEEETKQEIEEAVVESGEAPAELAPVVAADSEANLAAALREGDEHDEIIDEQLDVNPQEKRRVRMEMLAEKLQEVFGLEEREQVLEEMRCWLLRSVMLKGYMYLTPRHICFFAHMPSKENLIAKTGPLSKKNSRTKLYTKFWAVLRNDVLSWYESASDPYFPHGNVSLQYASSCEAVDGTRFKLRTAERNYTFTAETKDARDEWVRTIQKVMFKTQHEGENIKLIIPLEAVLEVDKAPTLEFAETIEIKCVDAEDAMSVDSYFFASFQNTARALESIQHLLSQRPSSELPQPIPHSANDSLESVAEDRPESTGVFNLRKIGSVLKPLVSHSTDKLEETKEAEEHRSSSLPIPFLKRHHASNDSMETVRMDQSQADNITGLSLDELGGYPPRQTGAAPPGFGEEKATWGTWIKRPASKIFGTSPSHASLFGKSPGSTSSLARSPSGASTVTKARPRKGRKRAAVTTVVEAADDGTSSEDEHVHRPKLSWTSDSDLEPEMETSRRSDFSLMEKSESHDNEEQETARKFRKVFALSDTEELIDQLPGYLYRVLPVSGRFFVSTNFFCFRSSQLLYKTKMIIPIRDLYGLKAQKAFRFGNSGLIIVIKGHEELFLEFSSSARRTACVKLLEERMEDVRVRSTSSPHADQDSDAVTLRIAEDLDENAPLEARSSGSIVSPSPMFGSTTSTFLEFKPEPMKVTCLTIGSRGDVQPYIALCKGLQAEGHTTRIATHGEYKDWVEGHGIEFASVGGDPAELMQMCVDNGMFTVSFLKEGLQKFRGWLDDLLHSSWDACQGSDLLIESPSAMGGIHIAEALRIPYYRAFTMPWTRTRAYPHAFAVPEHKRGGSYNYMTYTMFDQVFWRAIAGQVNRFRRNVLGIDPTTFDKLEQHKSPFLYNFSPHVVPPPLDWTEWIHVTGYWFLENADQNAASESKWSPPEGLLDFIEKAHSTGKKVVYIGFGSIVVSDPQEMTRCVVDAVVESGVCAILSKGWSDRGTKAKGESASDAEGADGVKFPPEIFAIDSIDHGWLFPRIDAACHHGGAGTTGASLRAGIPTIIKPFFGDQAFWAERVESLNVGSAVRKLTSEHLSEALKKATQDQKQIAKARIVGEMIRKENGVSRAIEAIYRDLEYAKSIIKPPPEDRSLHKTSSLLNPLASSSELVSHRRTGSKSSSKRPLSTVRSEVSEDYEQSDASWDVLSDDHHESGKSLLASPMVGASDAGRSRSGSGTGSMASGFLGRVGLSRG